jgi:hypothetical protein
MALYRPSDGHSRALDAAREKYLGHFDTGLGCISCGESNIIDHAVEKRPKGRAKWYGSQPTNAEKLRSFAISHRYSCGKCGAMYMGSSIERRGYKPLEVRQPISRDALTSKEGKDALDKMVAAALKQTRKKK